MTQAYVDQLNEMAKKLKEPFQAITELNLKTLQNMNYIKPEEMVHFKKPEELLDRQISLAVENGHKALDYLQKSFQIFEKAVLSLVKEVKEKTEIKG